MGELSAKLTERAFHEERHICPLTRFRGSSPKGRALKEPQTKAPSQNCHPERRGRKPPQSKDLRIGSHMMNFLKFRLHEVFDRMEILRH